MKRGQPSENYFKQYRKGQRAESPCPPAGGSFALSCVISEDVKAHSGLPGATELSPGTGPPSLFSVSLVFPTPLHLFPGTYDGSLAFGFSNPIQPSSCPATEVLLKYRTDFVTSLLMYLQGVPEVFKPN